jgi:hypothetical protein
MEAHPWKRLDSLRGFASHAVRERGRSYRNAHNGQLAGNGWFPAIALKTLDYVARLTI